jgi:hypothetical protein
MEDQIKKAEEHGKFQQKVLGTLELLVTKVTEANHRTTKLEQDMTSAKKDLAVAMTRVSGIDHIALRLKSERDHTREELIKSLQSDNERIREETRIGNRNKVWWAIGAMAVVLVIILTYVGLIAPELSNQII